ncbi:MAG: hypothetical protein GY788_30670 [bacterium]|nr:hypothetical protein [bacterium]
MEIDFEGLYEALAGREPGDWSKPTYGSAAFTRKTLTEAGWLPEATEPEAKARTGPAPKAA